MIRLNRQRALALGLSVAAVVAFGACDAGGGGATGARGIDKFNRNGPMDPNIVRAGQCTFFQIPEGQPGSRVGLGWANGTGGTPRTYTNLLTRVASFGANVVAANTTQSGTGRETSDCINTLDRQRRDSNSQFVASGHSQGGSGSINASRLNNLVRVTCPVQLDGQFTAQSNAGDIKGMPNAPALISCGTGDTLAPCGGAIASGNGNRKFAQARVPVLKVNVVGATHTAGGSPVQGGLYGALVTSCTQALAGDPEAIAALRPGGVGNSGTLREVERRNF